MPRRRSDQSRCSSALTFRPPPIVGQFTVPILMRMTRLRNEWNVGLRDNEERIPSENVMALEDLIARVFLIKFSATF